MAEALERSHVQCVDHVGTGWVGMIGLAGIRGQSAAAAGLRPPDRQPNKCRRAGVNEPKWAFSGGVGATGRDNMGGRPRSAARWRSLPAKPKRDRRGCRWAGDRNEGVSCARVVNGSVNETLHNAE